MKPAPPVTRTCCGLRAAGWRAQGRWTLVERASGALALESPPAELLRFGAWTSGGRLRPASPSACRHRLGQPLPVARVGNPPGFPRIGQVAALDQDRRAVLAAQHAQVSGPPHAPIMLGR